MEKIYTKNAPEPVGPYSQAIKVNGFLYCSGQIAINPKNNQFIDGDIKEQTQQVMKNIEAVLTAAGYSFDNVVKTMCFIDDMNNFGAFNEIYAQYFTSKPARSCVEAKLPKNAKVEVEIIAYKA
ncbi:MAG: RidA family protein [Candidatus Gastranaerophilales bacterium]|jgi:2-iminobutanoate/2-iminopropanoate deaminase|nr:RidA family protein [Candidatus Gastranaerophilales bacterium]